MPPIRPAQRWRSRLCLRGRWWCGCSAIMPSCGIRRAHAHENGPGSFPAGSAKRLDRRASPARSTGSRFQRAAGIRCPEMVACNSTVCRDPKRAQLCTFGGLRVLAGYLAIDFRWKQIADLRCATHHCLLRGQSRPCRPRGQRPFFKCCTGGETHLGRGAGFCCVRKPTMPRHWKLTSDDP